MNMDPKLLALAMQQGGGATPDLLAQLAQDGGLPDSSRRMIEMMMAMQLSGDAAPREDEDIAEPAPVPVRHDAKRELTRLRRLLAQSARHIDMLEDRAASFALAVGACPECFGADDACEICRGDGGPGRSAPDREAFRFFVLPVLDRLGRRRARAAPTSSPGGAEPAQPAQPDQRPERSASK